MPNKLISARLQIQSLPTAEEKEEKEFEKKIKDGEIISYHVIPILEAGNTIAFKHFALMKTK